MTSAAELPILKELITGGVPYGSNILVEFEPDSLWYETSFTIAANALKSGMRVEYHTYIRTPKEVEGLLARLGVDINKLEDAGFLEIHDSYTAQIGLSLSEEPEDSAKIGYAQSLKLSDWSIGLAKEMKARVVSRGTLHIDDNTSVLLQYNDEKAFIDVWRTRILPQTRVAESFFLYALVPGVGSSAFYKQLESLSDGIIDFKSPETGGRVEHLVRIRTMRGKTYDSRWHRLQLVENREAALAD